MKSPLATYKAAMKEAKVDPKLEVTPLQKIGFLQSQKEEIQGAMWRASVDVIHAKRLMESENPVLKAKGNNNYADHLNQLEQFSGAIIMLDKFIEELRKEYPELKPE